MQKSGRITVLLSGLLLLCAGLAGCGGEQTADTGLTYDQLGIPIAEELEPYWGYSIVFSDADARTAENAEIRGFYYDLAQDMRWDFLPHFTGGEAPTAVEDYIYLVLADALVWSDLYNIDHENTPETLSAAYVNDYILTHFGTTVPQPEAGPVVKVDFDGESYTCPVGSWKYPPHYALDYLVVQNLNGELVYTAGLTEYTDAGSAPRDDWREMIVSDAMDTAAVSVNSHIEVKFTLDENGAIVYRAVRDGADAETWQDHGYNWLGY